MVQNKHLKTVFHYFSEIFLSFYEMLPNEIMMINAIQIFILPRGKH